MKNTIAIVGRPNVGKSTLFNRLVGQRKAIMDNESGVTRDRHYGYGDWIGKYFTVIDTGGYVHDSDDIFEGEINKQVKLAIDEADVILFMVDVDAGLHGLDEEFANVLRRYRAKSRFIWLPTRPIPTLRAHARRRVLRPGPRRRRNLRHSAARTAPAPANCSMPW